VRLVTVSDWAGHVAFCVRHWIAADDRWSVGELLEIKSDVDVIRKGQCREGLGWVHMSQCERHTVKMLSRRTEDGQWLAGPGEVAGCDKRSRGVEE
jgi:hypothetical protein